MPQLPPPLPTNRAIILKHQRRGPARGDGRQRRGTLISKFSIAGMARTYFDSLPRGAYNTALGSSGSVENRRGRRRFAKERKAQ